MSGRARSQSSAAGGVAVVRLEQSSGAGAGNVITSRSNSGVSSRSRSHTSESLVLPPEETGPGVRRLSSQANLRRRRVNTQHGDSASLAPVDEDADAAGARGNELESVYNNYATIDWIRDQTIDRRKRAELDRLGCRTNPDTGELDQRPAFWSWLSAYRAFYKGQTWFLLLIVSVVSGTIAGGLDIAVEWLSDVKLGTCKGSFFLSLKRCCAEAPQPVRPTPAPDVGPRCERWISWSTMLMGGVSDELPNAVAVDYAVYIGLSGLLALVAALGVRYISQHAAGSGIPETKAILGGFIVQGFTSWRALVAKLGVIFAAASGLNLGKEGPLVHISSCVAAATASLFPRYATNEAKRRELFSAAAATGVSVAFGAPIGGVLFSLEEVSYYFPHKTLWRTFFGAAVGAFALHYANPFTDKLVLFQVTYSTPWYSFELIPFLLLGVVGGALGGLFVRLNVAWCAVRRRTALARFPISEAVSLAVLTAVVNYFSPFMRRNAAEELGRLFRECPTEAAVASGHAINDPLCSRPLWPAAMAAGSLVLAGLARFFLTVLTFGTRVPAGLFIPSLGIGALFGRALGLAVEQLWLSHESWFLFAPCPPFDANAARCVVPGVYALVGAAAMLSGVTRMTVSLVVIVLELTGNIDYIIPLMLVTSVAKWVAEAICREGIYDMHIELRGFPFLDNKHTVRSDRRASEIMTAADKVCVLNLGLDADGLPNHNLDADEADDLAEREEGAGRPSSSAPSPMTVSRSKYPAAMGPLTNDASSNTSRQHRELGSFDSHTGDDDDDDDDDHGGFVVEELPDSVGDAMALGSAGVAQAVGSSNVDRLFAGGGSAPRPSSFVDAQATAEKIRPKALRADAFEPACPGGCRPPRGHTVRSLFRFLRRHPYSGFPVLRDDGCVAGYLSRAALTRALLLIHSNPFVDANTPVVFEPPSLERGPTDAGGSGDESSTATDTNSRVSAAPDFGAVLDLSSFLDEVPLCVWPRSPLDVLVDLFAKLGLRTVLVVERGKLTGVLTKKDLLRWMHGKESFFVPQAFSDVAIPPVSNDQRRVNNSLINNNKVKSIN